MWRAYQRRGELAAYESPYGWCRRVMGNLLIDHHRSITAERSATERMQARTGTALETSTPDPADLAAAPNWDELVGTLSAQQRLAATLYYAEDRSVEAVAEDMGIAVGTVKSALSKARRNVRRALADHGGGLRSASDDWEALS